MLARANLISRAMAPRSPSTGSFRLRKHPHLYEINTWAWLEELSARAGRQIQLADVADSEWDTLEKRGFDIVWLMGVWQRSPESQRIALADPSNHAAYDRALPGWKAADVISSPYAVAGYTPDPRIGTWDALDRVRDKLHRRGMALFLDFVGNHTALDHPWTREHPEFYFWGTQQDFELNPSAFYPFPMRDGTRFLVLARDPYFPPWKDVAQLNHFHAGMRAAQLQDLRTIAKHCDGLRCDMAMLHLSDIFAKVWSHFLQDATAPKKEFWTEAHETVPGLVLLAEAYWGTEPRLLDLGFSFAYDKHLYDAVRDENADAARAILSAAPDYQARFARFLENHDEARCNMVFGGRLPAVVTMMGTLPGLRFYHQGELDGRRMQLPITLRVAAEETTDPMAKVLFEKILRITNEDVFHEGEWRLLQVAAEGAPTIGNLIVYEWRSRNSWKMIAVNPGSGSAQGRVGISDGAAPAKEYDFNDELNGVNYPRNGEELRNIGLFVRLEGHQAHLFDITPA